MSRFFIFEHIRKLYSDNSYDTYRHAAASPIRKGKITLSFLALSRETLSSGEFSDWDTSLLFLKLNNEIRQKMAWE